MSLGTERNEFIGLSNRAKIASAILTLFEASVDDLARATGLPTETVVSEVKALKKNVGGIRGSAQNGYSLINDAEQKLKLSDWLESQYPRL